MRTKKVGKNEAVLEWEQLPVDVQNGFIRNYTIFYKTSLGNETGNDASSPGPTPSSRLRAPMRPLLLLPPLPGGGPSAQTLAAQGCLRACRLS